VGSPLACQPGPTTGQQTGPHSQRRWADAQHKSVVRHFACGCNTAAANAVDTGTPSCPRLDRNVQENPMLHYAVVFLVIALIAALFGFGGIASSAVGIAQVLFFVFIVLAVASFLYGLIKKA
jgi:uncharacterized membrane protein YtjA (UPF0391 family)